MNQNIENYVLGILISANFLINYRDQPAIACDLMQTEIIDGNVCSVSTLRRLARKEGLLIQREISSLENDKQPPWI